jgi:hypothetical protein
LVPLHGIGDVVYDARNVVQGIQLMRECCHARFSKKDRGRVERCRAGHLCDHCRDPRQTSFSRREFVELQSHGTSSFVGAFRDLVPTNTRCRNRVSQSMSN